MNASKNAERPAKSFRGRTWGNILIGPYDHDATVLPIDPSHIEDVLAAQDIGAKDLLVDAFNTSRYLCVFQPLPGIALCARRENICAE
jgi:hypothetical protein